MFWCDRRHEGMGIPPGEPTDTWREDGTCSYCGSVSPSLFFERVLAGDEVGPTDKNYKAYIGERGKFYFQHLSEEEKNRFIELYNNKTMKLGFPGHFYSRPFFCAVAPKE